MSFEHPEKKEILEEGEEAEEKRELILALAYVKSDGHPDVHHKI